MLGMAAVAVLSVGLLTQQLMAQQVLSQPVLSQAAVQPMPSQGRVVQPMPSQMRGVQPTRSYRSYSVNPSRGDVRRGGPHSGESTWRHAGAKPGGHYGSGR
jgi:hypothetical protein